MKPRNFLIFVLVALFIGGAIWQFSQTPEYVATATIKVYPAAKAAAPKAATPVAPVAQVELPKAAAVGAKEGTADSQAEAVAISQAELNATIADIVRLAKDHDLADIYTTYWLPNKQDQAKLAVIRKMEQSYRDGAIKYPDVYKTIVAMDHTWEVLADQSPKFNAAGDEATFMQPYPDFEGNGGPVDGGPAKYTPLTFIRVDGKWYIKP